MKLVSVDDPKKSELVTGLDSPVLVLTVSKLVISLVDVDSNELELCSKLVVFEFRLLMVELPAISVVESSLETELRAIELVSNAVPLDSKLFDASELGVDSMGSSVVLEIE